MINRLAEYVTHEYGTHSGETATANSAAPTPRPFIRGSDVQEIVQPVENLILKYPAVALVSAFAVGVLIAWWVKRK